jgi:hypothetical protein
MNRQRPGQDRQKPADDGVIAIIVALSVSTFLLGFAALAVDLGSAYTREAEMQSIADQLAVAGAAGLPDVDAARTGALALIQSSLTELCKNSATPGICPENRSETPSLAWATDHDADNGEIEFVTDPDGDGQYSLADLVTDFRPGNPVKATALVVTLPPSVVQFGLAGAFGFDQAVIHKSATARIGTPLGRGLLPFALTPADLAGGQFCVRTGSTGSGNAVYPGAQGPVQLSLPAEAGAEPPDADGRTIDITLRVPPRTPRPRNVRFFFSNSPDPAVSVQKSPLVWTVTLPPGAPGEKAQVWATGTLGGRRTFRTPFVTPAADVQYTGVRPAGTDPCTEPAANRGFLDLARSPAVGDPLSANVRSGPDVLLYPAGGPLGDLGTALRCASETFAPATTCLSTSSLTTFADQLRDGLLDPDGTEPGRLIGDCGNGTISSRGTSGVDASNLFDPDDGLVDPGRGDTLEDRLTGRDGPAAIAATDADHGLVLSAALRCPRLAVMPVIDPDPLGGVIGTTGYRITSFRYVWIDDTSSGSRGLNGSGSGLSSIRGYVLDGGYLPARVAGSPTVGPWLGGDMPKETLLIHDLGTEEP